MLGLGMEKDGEGKTDFEYKYRTNIRYVMEKYRTSMSKSVSMYYPSCVMELQRWSARACS